MRHACPLLVLLALSLAGCGGSPAGDLCDKACECSSCEDTARDQCVDQVEETRDAADEAGCGGEMDTYIECVTDELSCSEPSIEGLCPGEYEAVADCAGESASTDSTSPSPSSLAPATAALHLAR